MPDPIERWDQAKLLELAKTTGKPLEVECALKFVESNAVANPVIPEGAGAPAIRQQLAPTWRVELGSYYKDDATEKLRELDVLVTRTKMVERQNVGRIHTFVRAMVSCKGFPPAIGPIAFAIDGSLVDSKPSLMFGESQSNGFPGGFVTEAAEMLLLAVKLRDNAGNKPMIIGYNVVEQHENGGAKEYRRIKDREKDLFENGMDSAVKAAVAWRALIFPTHVKAAGAFIPILVLEKPWWQFPSDTGQAAQPTLTKRGFLVNSYPISKGKMPLDLVSLMCTKDELRDVILGIEQFADWFGDTAATMYR